MDEEVFNTSIRKFLKKVGITSQIEIEKVIADALSNGEIDQDAVCKVSVLRRLSKCAARTERSCVGFFYSHHLTAIND